MIITVNELINELRKLKEDGFIIGYNAEEKSDYAIDKVTKRIENDRWCYELRIGKNV